MNYNISRIKTKYSKSYITFDDLEKKANKAFEFGNDWGLYIDIENCELYYDSYLEKYKYKYNFYAVNKKPIFMNNRKNLNNHNNDNNSNEHTLDDNNIFANIKNYLVNFKTTFSLKGLLNSYFICILIGGAFIIKNYFIINKIQN